MGFCWQKKMPEKLLQVYKWQSSTKEWPTCFGCLAVCHLPLEFKMRKFYSAKSQGKLIYTIHCAKSVCILSFSGPYFSAFGLNTERYRVSLRIQSACGKMRTRKTCNMDTFHAVYIRAYTLKVFTLCKKYSKGTGLLQ